MPRLRPLAPLAVPCALAALALGCERLAGVDGSFARQAEGASGAGAGTGVGGGGGGVNGQGNAGSSATGGQAGSGGGGAAGGPLMGAGGSGGGTPPEVIMTALASGQRNVRQLVSDQSTLFWVSAGTAASGFADGAVRACAVTGCEDAPRTLADEQLKPEFIGVTDTNAGQLPESITWSSQVYWTNTLSGTVLRCAKTGCAQPSVVAEGQVNPRGVNVSSSLSNSTGGAGEVHAYWATAGEGATTGEIKRCKLDLAGPCATPEVLETNLKAPTKLVTGRSYIYWISSGTQATAFADGELHRFRKNVEPAPDRPLEARSFPMSKSLHGPVSLELQVSRLYVSTLGSASPDAAAGVWVGRPTDVDNSATQMQQFVSNGPVTAAVATPKTLYWAGGGTLYGCPLDRCPAAGPIELARNVGAGPMYVDQGVTDDLIFTVNDATIIKIRVPVALTALPPLQFLCCVAAWVVASGVPIALEMCQRRPANRLSVRMQVAV